MAKVSKDGMSLGLDWESDLPKGNISGSRATYDAGSNRKVRVTATDIGFNVNVVLERAPAKPPVFRLPVRASGVTLAAGADGGFVATNGAGDTVFRIAPPLMWDQTQTS